MARAGKFLTFDIDGTPTVSAGSADGITVSPFAAICHSRASPTFEVTMSNDYDCSTEQMLPECRRVFALTKDCELANGRTSAAAGMSGICIVYEYQ